MGFKRVTISIPMEQIKDFRAGKTIQVSMPADCRLQAGDHCLYDCGQTVYGAAELVSFDSATAAGELKRVN